MTVDNILQKAIALKDSMLQVTSGIYVTVDNSWSMLVCVGIHQGNKRLDAILTLLNKNDLDSAEILTRSLFELAVNLAYIDEDVSVRLPEYLKHGKVPTTREEVEKLKEEMGNSGQLEARKIVPKNTWETLRSMCCDLGLDWLDEYETFFRFVSILTHADAFTLGENYKRLLEKQLPSDSEKATVLVTALDFHLRVASVTARVFPAQIKPELVKGMRDKCQELGQSLI